MCIYLTNINLTGTKKSEIPESGFGTKEYPLVAFCRTTDNYDPVYIV